MSFNLSDVNGFFWSGILKAVSDFEKRKEKKIVVLCSLAPQNVKLGIFMLWSCKDGREMCKKA